MEVAIYMRTSTEEQNPQNQLKDCVGLVGGEKYKLYEEKQSAWKEEEKRECFNLVKEEIKQKRIKLLIVWDLDRIYRNRKKLIQFFEFCKIYGCEVKSFRQRWLNDLSNIPSPFNEIMFNLMLQIMGWLAEEESSKKSERVKASITKDDKGKTHSKYGKVWGRKVISEKVKEDIINLREQGKSFREICKEIYYWDDQRHKHQVSMGFVHKTISNFDAKKVRK